MVMNLCLARRDKLTLMFVFPHVDHYRGIMDYEEHIRNAKISIVGTTPPAEEKKRTMIVLIRGVAPVGTFSTGPI